MNILFVTDFYKPHIGGVEKLFSSLAEKLVEKGNRVTFITWKYNKKLSARENINGVTIIRITSPTRLLFSIIGLFKIIDYSRKADLIHTSTYSSAIGAWLGSKFTGKKIVLTVHEVWGNLWLEMPFLSIVQKTMFKGFERWLLRLKFHQYIAVSDFTKNKLIESGIPTEKIKRIYNGIDYDVQRWSDHRQPYTFTFFGRAGASKGLDILIDAAERMITAHPDVRFKFIISPQIKKVYSQVISKIKTGTLNKKSLLFSQLPYPLLEKELLTSNCIIIPSLCEGFGFTAVETAAMNIPLISSGMGSLPEVVSGKVITMKIFSSESLFLAMEAALNNQFELIPEKKFSVDSFIEHHDSLYHELLGYPFNDTSLKEKRRCSEGVAKV
jgi:glycosyltransferase involved in cell wall biosynthesis